MMQQSQGRRRAAIVASALVALVSLGSGQGLAATVPPPIAAQMYTMRFLPGVDTQMAAVKNAGVNYIETVGTHGQTADEMNALLAANGLSVISSHVGLDVLRSDLAGTITFNQAIGNDTITMPWLSPDERPSDAAGWTALGLEMKGFADHVVAAGMQFAYHNHDFEMVEFGGQTALEILLAAAGPNVQSQLDLAWVDRGGQDPVDMLGRLSGRIHSVHAKDNAIPGASDPTYGAGFAALGRGVLDWDAIVPAALDAGVGWFIVEHDFPPDAERVVRIGNGVLTRELSPVPVPGALPLLAGGLVMLGAARLRRRH